MYQEHYDGTFEFWSISTYRGEFLLGKKPISRGHR